MRRTPWIMCAWPGLPQLWRGAWSGLAVALAFAAMLNAALLMSVIWPEWVSSTARTGLWIVLAVGWVGGIWAGRRYSPGAAEPRGAVLGDLFPAAMGQYLQGNWLEAERTLKQLIDRKPRDVPARLMLATLWRRTDRHAEARQALTELRRFEEADKWRAEIAREWEYLGVELKAAA